MADFKSVEGRQVVIQKVRGFFQSPIGLLLLLAAAFLIGSWQARRSADARCETRAQISIEAARQVDRQAAAETAQRIQQQADENAARAAEAEKRFVEYANEVAQRPNPACSLLDPDVERLREDTVSGSPERVTLPPKRGAGSNTAPVRKPR